MENIYAVKRKEPRVKLHTQVRITTLSQTGPPQTYETVTLDVSPHGASVRIERALPLGSVVQFAAVGYKFETRAVVRSVVPDRLAGDYLIGLEYADDRTNPIVGWSAKRASREAACES